MTGQGYSSAPAAPSRTTGLMVGSAGGWRGRVRGALAVVAGVLLIVAGIAANGRPTVFTDTDDYYLLGRELAQSATALLFPKPPSTEPLTAEEVADAAQAAEDDHLGHTQMASRSALYSVFLYGLERLGSLWLLAVAQASIISWLLYRLWRVALPQASRVGFVGGVAVLVVTSTLPFFAGFAMPDIFAGITALATTLLLLFPDRISVRERWLIGAMLVFALAVHTSHILFVAPLLVVAFVILGQLGVGSRRRFGRLGAIAAALVIAMALNSAYGLAVRLQTGDVLRHQPFLTARVLADGPGRLYLRHACAEGVVYTLCRFRHKPLDDSEDILWSDLPATGVFLLSDYATRVRLEAEEPRFVLATLAYDPVGQFVASMRNWGRQLGEIYVDDPLRNPVFYLTDPYWRETSLPLLIRRVADCGASGRTCPSRLTIAGSRLWHGSMLGVAVAAIAWASLRLWRRNPARIGGDDDRRLLAMLVLLTAAIVINAAVCGILSGPFARYQARVIWLVPAMAIILVVAALRDRRSRLQMPA